MDRKERVALNALLALGVSTAGIIIAPTTLAVIGFSALGIGYGSYAVYKLAKLNKGKVEQLSAEETTTLPREELAKKVEEKMEETAQENVLEGIDPKEVEDAIEPKDINR